MANGGLKMSVIKNFKIIKFYQDEEDEQKCPNCYQLIADFGTREVSTNCGDFYYDLSFSFDDFINFAKHIEEQDKILNKGEIDCEPVKEMDGWRKNK